jgi:hypothetical protein
MLGIGSHVNKGPNILKTEGSPVFLPVCYARALYYNNPNFMNEVESNCFALVLCEVHSFLC